MAFVVTAVIAAFEVGATAAVILTAVTEVGLACTVVGAVTGNKDLMKVGSVLGIVGGVGSLVNAGISSLAEGAAVDAATTAAGSAANDGLATAATNSVADATTDSLTNSLAETAPVNFGDIANAGNAPSVSGAANLSDSASSLATPMPTTPYGMSSSNALTDAGSAESLNGVDANGLSPNYANAPSAPALADGTNNASNVVNNVQNTGSQFGTPGSDGVGGTYDQNGNLIPNANHGVEAGTGATGGIVDSLKSGVDATSKWFKGLQPLAQSEILKSLMAVPGGIQQQKAAAARLALDQQRVNQTSYGSSVPKYGIIASNQKG